MITYNKKNVKDNTLELGDDKIVQYGKNGKESVNYRITGSPLQRLFDKYFGTDFVSSSVISRQTISKPIEQLVATGAKRYQYMHCSNGGYRYYTDEQFKDPSSGFTSESKDSCKENKQGEKIQLADGPPGQQNKRSKSSTPSYVPSNCTKIKIPHETEYKYVSYLLEGERRIYDGYDGYKYSCSKDSTGYMSPIDGMEVKPYNRTIYIGTGAGQEANDNHASSLMQWNYRYNSAYQTCISSKPLGSVSNPAGYSSWESYCSSRATQQAGPRP